MEPQIVDFYKEMPSGVYVIDKMNEELDEIQKELDETQKENKKLKEENKLLNCFKKPQIEDDNITIFKQNIEQSFITVCNGDEDDLEPLSYKLMEDYLNHRNPEYKKYSVIKYLIEELDNLTNHQNPEWCELKVLTTIEAFGFTTKHTDWEPPRINTLESLVESISDFEISLISLIPFQTE